MWTTAKYDTFGTNWDWTCALENKFGCDSVTEPSEQLCTLTKGANAMLATHVIVSNL